LSAVTRALLAAGLAATALVVAPAHGVETPAAGTGGGEFLTAYEKPATADYAIYYDELRRERFLESVAQELNRVLDLPAPVALRIAECGHSTTTWSAPTRTITICYEFLDAVLVIASEETHSAERAEQLFSGAVTFALFDEVGQALVALYGLPAPRGPGHSGDQFAAITLAAAEQDGDPSAAAALEFLNAALRQPDSGFEYLETHAFDRSRLEDVGCILYGNAPANHAAALASGIVSAARAPRCAEEVVATAKAWDLYLRDHSKATPVPAPEPESAPGPAPAGSPPTASPPATASPPPEALRNPPGEKDR
jgi:hypothetical protein